MKETQCVYCKRDDLEVPLISLSFGGRDFHICPQHLPILIHDPARLVDKLPGAEKLSPSEHQD